MKTVIILIFLLINGYSFSQNLEDSCKDIIKKYDPFKEDSILQTRTEKLGIIFFKFLLESKNQISLRFQFYTYTSEVIYSGIYFYLYLADSSVIKLKLTDDSYPGVSGRNYFVHNITFVLKDAAVLQKLKFTPIVSAKCSDYDFINLTNQKTFMENLKCISMYLK